MIPSIADPVERGIQGGNIEQRRASLARRTGDLPKAAESIHRAIELLTRAVGPNHPSLGPAWNELGIVERDRGDHDASILAYENALAISRKLYGAVDVRTIGAESNLAPPAHVAIPRTRLDLIKALIALQRNEEAGAELAKAQAEFLAAHDTTPTDRKTIGDMSVALAGHVQKAGAIEVH